MKISIFTVYPVSVAFHTTDISGAKGDKNAAFYNAHLYAANLAAGQKRPYWVVKDDSEICTFGPKASLIPTTALYRINKLCLNSYWDYSSRCWLPLEEIMADDRLQIEAHV